MPYTGADALPGGVLLTDGGRFPALGERRLVLLGEFYTSPEGWKGQVSSFSTRS